jgi:nucleoid DNA-binding protein
MRPKKAKEFIKPTALNMNLSESMVEDVISFYWSAIQKALSNIESASVTVAGLGIFKVRVKKIKKLQARYTKYLENTDPESMTFNKHSVKKLAEFKLERLSIIEKDLEKERKKKEEVKLKRAEYVANKTMEKQE